MHIFVCRYIFNFSFSVLNFILAAGKPNFAEVVCITQKVDQTCSKHFWPSLKQLNQATAQLVISLVVC